MENQSLICAMLAKEKNNDPTIQLVATRMLASKKQVHVRFNKQERTENVNQHVLIRVSRGVSHCVCSSKESEIHTRLRVGFHHQSGVGIKGVSSFRGDCAMHF